MLALASALPLCGVALALAVDLPPLQPGQWEYRRTVASAGRQQPVVQTMLKCSNPTEEIRAKWQSLASPPCQFSPLQHIGGKYQYSTLCTKNGVTVRTMSIITVQGDSAYNVVTERHSGNSKSSETLAARRVADCANPPLP